MKKINLVFSIIMLALVVSSCNKDAKTYPVNIRMTDYPAVYDGVYIDLREVQITGNDGQAVSMEVNEGIYNLLDFSNGVDTLIATGALEVADLEQIRLILGPNNTVRIDGITYPLSTPSADQSGLKLQVHATLEAGVAYNILLDFDANKSIVSTGNGTYKLKPVIRTIESAMRGSIIGKISPIGTLAVVTVTSNGAYSSNVTTGGDFMQMGLPAGTYVMSVSPVLPFGEYSQLNIVVTDGETTNVGTIVLQ